MLVLLDLKQIKQEFGKRTRYSECWILGPGGSWMSSKVLKTIANIVEKRAENRTDCHQCLGNMPVDVGHKSTSIESRQPCINQDESQSKIVNFTEFSRAGGYKLSN